MLQFKGPTEINFINGLCYLERQSDIFICFSLFK